MRYSWPALLPAVLVAVLGAASVSPAARSRPTRRLREIARTPEVPGGTSERAVVGASARVDLLVLLTLIEVALGTGASLTRTLAAVGDAVGGDEGRALRTVGAALTLGAAWSQAWELAPVELTTVRDCLRGSWESGAAAGPGLRAAANQIRRRRRRESREAIGRLGVQLVLPLGLCFLPASVLLGLVPLAISLAADLWA